MKIHSCLQRSEEWLTLRAGLVTASEFHKLITPLWKPRDGVQTYLCEKLAERYLGRALPAFSGFGEMEQGTILEDEAIPWYELEHECTVQRVGFITHDDGRSGCSPDGLLAPCAECHGSGIEPGSINCADDGNDCPACAGLCLGPGGIEIKCPQAHTHVRYLLDATLPKEYAAQVHGSMYVTGCSWWKFLSYRRGFPPLLLTVERDDKIQKVIRQTLGDFNDRLDEAFLKLKERAM